MLILGLMFMYTIRDYEEWSTGLTSGRYSRFTMLVFGRRYPGFLRRIGYSWHNRSDTEVHCRYSGKIVQVVSYCPGSAADCIYVREQMLRTSQIDQNSFGLGSS